MRSSGGRWTARDENHFWTFTFHLPSQSVRFTHGSSLRKEADLPSPPPYHFRVMVWQDRAALEVGGKILHQVAIPPSARNKHLLGLGGLFENSPGCVVGFGELKLRRLAEPPDWAVEKNQLSE